MSVLLIIRLIKIAKKLAGKAAQGQGGSANLQAPHGSSAGSYEQYGAYAAHDGYGYGYAQQQQQPAYGSGYGGNPFAQQQPQQHYPQQQSAPAVGYCY